MPKPLPARIPGPTDDPIVFWSAAYRQSEADAKKARSEAPSVVPLHVRQAREAWQALQAAKLAQNPTAPMDGEEAPEAGSLEEELAIAVRMRKSAEAAGSHVAARQGFADERAIRQRIRERDEAARKAARAGRSPDEVVAALAAKIAAMPDAMRARLRTAVGW